MAPFSIKQQSLEGFKLPSIPFVDNGAKSIRLKLRARAVFAASFIRCFIKVEVKFLKKKGFYFFNITNQGLISSRYLRVKLSDFTSFEWQALFSPEVDAPQKNQLAKNNF